MKPAAMLLIALIAAAPATASALPGGDRSRIDLDGDGRYSLPELRMMYPTLGAEAFALLDADGDGVVSPGEFRQGQDEGLLPIPTGG